MEIHQLRYFLAVAEHRNFGRAARSVRVAQPSLSLQIKKLEEELSERLFDRGRTGVTLTPAGLAFHPHAERVLQQLGDAARSVQGLGGRVRGQVRLGALPTVAPFVLPAALRTCARQHRELELLAHEDLTVALVQAVENRELDLALVSSPVVSQRVTTEVLGEEELCLALPRSHRFAKRSRVSLADVADDPFLLMKEGHCLSGQVLAVCAAREMAPQVSFRSAQMETLRALVASGQGVSLIPAMACTPAKGLVYRSVAGDPPTRKLALIHRKDQPLSVACQAVADALRKELLALPSFRSP